MFNAASAAVKTIFRASLLGMISASGRAFLMYASDYDGGFPAPITNYGTTHNAIPPTWVTGTPGVYTGQFKDDGGGNGVVFNNYGTFRKSAGTNTSQTTFNSGVVLNQLAGQLDLQRRNHDRGGLGRHG